MWTRCFSQKKTPEMEGKNEFAVFGAGVQKIHMNTHSFKLFWGAIVIIYGWLGKLRPEKDGASDTGIDN